MATLALPRPLRGDRTRRALTDTTAALLVVAVAAGSTYFIDHWGARKGVGMGLFLVGLCWFAATRRTLVALAVFMAYIGMADGYAKLSTGSTVVSLVRDALLFAIVVGVLVRAQVSGKPLRLPPLSGWVITFVVVVFAQVLNPSGGTFTHSLAGVRQHLEFVPLFFLAFAFLRTKAALRGFVILLLVIGAANGIAGYLQFNLTAQEFAAWGPGYADRVLGRGAFVDAGRTFTSGDTTGLVRPFGLGSDAGAGGVMGAFALGALLVLITRFTRMRYLLLAAALAMGVIAAIVTSQGRAPVLAAAIIVVTYGLLTLTAGGRLATLLGLGVTAVVVLFVFQGIAGSATQSGADDAFRYSGLTPSKIVATADEARGSSIAVIPQNIVDYPLGAGLGSVGPAASYKGGTTLIDTVDTESWFSFIVVETGIPGLLTVFGFTITLLWLAFVRIRKEPDPETRALLAAMLAPLAALLALYWTGGGLTATTPYAPYLWTIGGVVAYWLIERPAALRAAADR
jgi:hypothetical protein